MSGNTNLIYGQVNTTRLQSKMGNSYLYSGDTMKKCEVTNCENPLFYEGLCQGHFYMKNPNPEVEVFNKETKKRKAKISKGDARK